MRKTFFEESQGIALGAIALSLIMFVCNATPYSINKRWKKDAVDRGFAEWVIDADGDPTFQWKKSPNDPETLLLPPPESPRAMLLPDEMN